ncbi:MAG TPA: glycine cleavage system protein H [Candidatus Sumerlaeota bacterium]|nr:glycine cleavage system protein H [Candidatus Sumerlaeota bacterium]
MLREDKALHPFWFEEAAEAPGAGRIGLTEAFLESVGEEIVGLELARAGDRVRAGETFGFLHTHRRSLDLRAPRSLRIRSINAAAVADARLVRQSPYGRGWLAEVEWDEGSQF